MVSEWGGGITKVKTCSRTDFKRPDRVEWRTDFHSSLLILLYCLDVFTRARGAPVIENGSLLRQKGQRRPESSGISFLILGKVKYTAFQGPSTGACGRRRSWDPWGRSRHAGPSLPRASPPLSPALTRARDRELGSSWKACLPAPPAIPVGRRHCRTFGPQWLFFAFFFFLTET